MLRHPATKVPEVHGPRAEAAQRITPLNTTHEGNRCPKMAEAPARKQKATCTDRFWLPRVHRATPQPTDMRAAGEANIEPISPSHRHAACTPAHEISLRSGICLRKVSHCNLRTNDVASPLNSRALPLSLRQVRSAKSDSQPSPHPLVPKSAAYVPFAMQAHVESNRPCSPHELWSGR